MTTARKTTPAAPEGYSDVRIQPPGIDNIVKPVKSG